MAQDNWETIRVPQDAKEVAKERKESNNQTWGEYITGDDVGSPDAEDIATELTAKINVDTREAEQDLEELRELVNDVSTSVEDLSGKLDDLAARMPREVANELQR